MYLIVFGCIQIAEESKVTHNIFKVYILPYVHINVYVQKVKVCVIRAMYVPF